MSSFKSIFEFLPKLIKTARSYVSGVFDMGNPGEGGGLIQEFAGGDIEDGKNDSKGKWLGIGILGLLILIFVFLVLGSFFDIFPEITIDSPTPSLTQTPTVFFDVFNPIDIVSSTPTPTVFFDIFETIEISTLTPTPKPPLRPTPTPTRAPRDTQEPQVCYDARGMVIPCP